MKFLSSERLSPHRFKTPEGYLICTDAILARTGKQTYRRNEVFRDGDDSEIEVDRKSEEVFSPETLASFENKPITVEHPNTDVNSDNYSDLAVGFVRDVRKGEVDGQEVMLGNLVITDAQTIEEIENGEHTDLSCGYDCEIVDEQNPQQTKIRGNHVALCEQGRAGIARIVDSETIKDAQFKTYGELKNGDKVLFNGQKATVNNVKVIGKSEFGSHKGENIISFTVEFDKDEELSKYGQYQGGRYQGVESLTIRMQDSTKDSLTDEQQRKLEQILRRADKYTLFEICYGPYRGIGGIGASKAELLEDAMYKLAELDVNKVNEILRKNRVQTIDSMQDSKAMTDLEAIPMKARKELEQATNKEAKLLEIYNEMEDIINRADDKDKAIMKNMAKKIFNDLKIQFKAKIDFLDSINDSYVVKVEGKDFTFYASQGTNTSVFTDNIVDAYKFNSVQEAEIYVEQYKQRSHSANEKVSIVRIADSKLKSFEIHQNDSDSETIHLVKAKSLPEAIIKFERRNKKNDK